MRSAIKFAFLETSVSVRRLFLSIVAISAAVLLAPAAALAQSCGGCPPGQVTYCGSNGCYCVPGTPIIIDLSGDGFTLTSPAEGVQFDFFLSGPVQISWTPLGADEGWLVLDRSGDGKITNGAEMFGNLTPQPPSEDPNGFLALAVYDDPSNGGNGDGIIDSRDTIFSRLRIWRDSNHNGISEPWELISLQDAGIKSISLDYTETGHIDKWGNRFRYRARIGSTAGADKWAYDVILQFTKTTMTSGEIPRTVGDGPLQAAKTAQLKRPQLGLGAAASLSTVPSDPLRQKDENFLVPRAAGLDFHEMAKSFVLIMWSRALIGLLLTAAAFLKMVDFDAFRVAVHGFDLLPGRMTFAAACFLVIVEASTGLLILAGAAFKDAVLRWAPVSGAALFFVFGLAIAINLVRGRRDIACGCFASTYADGISWVLVIRNAVLCVIALVGFQSLQGASWPKYSHGGERLDSVLLAVFTLLAGKLFFAVRRLWGYGRDLTLSGGVE